MTIDSCEIIELIEKHYTEWLWPLLAIAHAKTRRLKWKGQRRGPIPEGMQPEDFVAIAIEKTIDGTRRFNPVEGEDIAKALYKHLDDTIDSLVSHAVESYENRKVDNSLSEANPVTGLVPEAPDFESPLDALIEKNEKEKYEDFLFSFIDYINDDPQLKEAFVLFYDGCPHSEIAEKMKISIEQTYQLRRKIKRRIESFAAKREKVKTSTGGKND